jgi:hypothetical protein
MPVTRDQVNWVPMWKEGRSHAIHPTLTRILTIPLSGLLAAVLTAAAAAPALGQASGTWVTTGSMPGPSLGGYTATLLPNGQVLVAGGLDSATNTAYATAFLYNPSTGTWTETGSLLTARYSHRAALLANGDVLVTGGQNNTGGTLADSELYNPSTGTWSKGATMVEGHHDHSMVLLSDGYMLVAGGYCSRTYCGNGNPTYSADLYNPSTQKFVEAASMHEGRGSTELTLLQNGSALIAAGGAAGDDDATCSAEIFTQGHGWKLTSSLVQCATGATITYAVTLPNGNALIENGNTASEFYVPATNVWQATLNQPNVHGPLALLTTGNVLVAGSALVSGDSNAALYNPSTNEWTPGGQRTSGSPPDSDAALKRPGARNRRQQRGALHALERTRGAATAGESHFQLRLLQTEKGTRRAGGAVFD